MGKRKFERRNEKVAIQFKKELLKHHFGSGTRPKIFDKF